ncbi:MAG: TolC family protein [Acidobacteria bacterium]|nr:MAG: TolC family protein [Acidobacteriota bacterium]
MSILQPRRIGRQQQSVSGSCSIITLYAAVMFAAISCLIPIPVRAVQGVEPPDQAQPAKAATPLSQLVKEAEMNNPQILAARRGWQAATQVPSQVSTLPDPELMVEHMSAGTPLPFDGFHSVEMTYLGFGVSQSIPYPGKLRLRGEIARRKADTLLMQSDTVRRSVIEQVKTAYFRLDYVRQTLSILEKNEKLLAQVEKIAEARYRTGQGNQQDVLKAQLQQTKLLRDATQYFQQMQTLQAQLKQLLNRPQDSADIITEKLTETALPYSSDDLLAAVRTGNSEVGAQHEMMQDRSLQVELARKDFYPDFSVQYLYQHTAAVFPERYMISFGVTLPIFRNRRQRPEVAEAAEQLNSSRRAYEAQVQQAYFEVRDQYLVADSDSKVLKIYREGLIPQATATFDAGLAAYQSAQQDFETLLSSFLDVLNLDIEYWRTLAEHESALARLEQLTGVQIP